MQLETCYTEVNRDIRCHEQSTVSFRKTNKEVKQLTKSSCTLLCSMKASSIQSLTSLTTFVQLHPAMSTPMASSQKLRPLDDTVKSLCDVKEQVTQKAGYTSFYRKHCPASKVAVTALRVLSPQPDCPPFCNASVCPLDGVLSCSNGDLQVRDP